MVRVGVGLRVRHDVQRGAAEVGRVPDRLLSAVRDGTRDAADLLRDAMRREIPRDTGRAAATVGSVVNDTPRGAEAFSGTSDEVAILLELETRPHDIVPRRQGGVLRFRIGGRTVFAKRVRHPGTRAYNWMLVSSEASVPELRRAYEESVRGALR